MIYGEPGGTGQEPGQNQSDLQNNGPSLINVGGDLRRFTGSSNEGLLFGGCSIIRILVRFVGTKVFQRVSGLQVTPEQFPDECSIV